MNALYASNILIVGTGQNWPSLRTGSTMNKVERWLEIVWLNNGWQEYTETNVV